MTIMHLQMVEGTVELISQWVITLCWCLCCPQTQASYILTVKGTDMDGAPGGNTGTGTIHVKVVDINDNIPTLEKDEVFNQRNFSDIKFKKCIVQ